VKNGEMMFGQVIDGKMQLSEYGKVAQDELRKTASMLNVDLGASIIMPNHAHFIISLNKPQPVGADMNPPDLSSIVRAYKAAVTRRIGFSLWQRSFFDNILHDDDERRCIEEYIFKNPATWEKDRFYFI